MVEKVGQGQNVWQFYFFPKLMTRNDDSKTKLWEQFSKLGGYQPIKGEDSEVGSNLHLGKIDNNL